jgi:hypothetical protein
MAGHEHGALLGRTLPDPEDTVSNRTYVSDITSKIGLLPRAVRRIGLALVVCVRVAGAADIGYGTLRAGHDLETSDDIGRDFSAALSATTQRSLFLQSRK